jgi:hypothetical protein
MECADDMLNICGAARGEVLHGNNMRTINPPGANSGTAPAADETFPLCDALQTAMMALNHLSS